MQSNIFSNGDLEPCPLCNSTERIVDNQRAEISCALCGLVLDESLVDNGPEWRAFDHEQRDKRTRVGAPLTYTISDKGLTTTIDWKNKDSNGRMISERNRAQMYRLRKWNKRLRVSRAGERNLAHALSEIDRVSSKLDLPRSPVREDASVIYRQATKKQLIRGRSIESMVAASIYTACRRCDIPRTLEEISEMSQVPKKQIGKNYRFLARELNIKLKPTSPVDYIPRFATRLGLSNKVQIKAIDIINISMKNGFNSGKGPTGVAAAALYIASMLLGERKSQKVVAGVAGVTEVTIRNRYKELSELDLGTSL
ncbi:transcription initiation factor IIB [Methanobrevibacter sp.]|uniref:transcription initiation factor IIB n=1 Tax=Methanobrevibacter sp. TaxID=66852 RepID=UPI00388F8383